MCLSLGAAKALSPESHHRYFSYSRYPRDCDRRASKTSVTSPDHQLSAPDTLSCTKAGALRHRSSLPYERASDQGLELELELQTQVLCGCRRMRSTPTADRKISFRQVASVRGSSSLEHDSPADSKIVAGAAILVENGPRATGSIARAIY